MAVQLDVGHPILLAPGTGETLTKNAKRSVVIKAEHELMDVTEVRYGPGEPGPRPHIHRQHTDAFYVLDGELTVAIGFDGEEITAVTGALVLVPAGVVHTFRNAGTTAAHLLNIHAPSMGFAESLRARRRDPRTFDPARYDMFDPPASGTRATADAVVRGPGEGDAIALGLSDALFKAEGGDGDGTFSMTEVTLAPGFPGPVPHSHARLVDSYYVLEGMLTIRAGDEIVELAPDSYAAVPPGVAHTFANRSETKTCVLNIMAPGGFEQYLKEVAGAMAPGSPPDPTAVAGIASRYDFTPVE